MDMSEVIFFISDEDRIKRDMAQRLFLSFDQTEVVSRSLIESELRIRMGCIMTSSKYKNQLFGWLSYAFARYKFINTIDSQ